MRSWTMTCLLVAIALTAGPDALARPQTPQTPVGITRQTLFENARVRVLRLKVEPGAMEQVHTHPYDVLITMLTPGDVVSVIGDQKTQAHRETNYTLFIPKGTKHAGGNYGREPYEVLTVLIVK